MIIFSLLFLSLSVWSQTVSVPWTCPQNGKNPNLRIPETRAVSIKLGTYPSIENLTELQIDQPIRDTSINYGDCISRFLRAANTAYTTWAAANCATPSTDNGIVAACRSGVQTFETSVHAGVDSSWFVSRNRSMVKFIPPSIEPAAAALLQELETNPDLDLMNLSGERTFDGVARPLASYGYVVRDQLLRQLDSKRSEEDKRKFIDSFAYANANSLRSPEQIRASCANPTDCSNQLKIREDVLFTARQMLARVYRENEVETRLNALCPVSGATNPGIEDLLEGLRRSSCDQDEGGNFPLQAGQFRLVERRRSGADYLLRRTDEGYEGVLNLNFDYQDGAITPAEMNQRVQGCVELANQRMRGPDQTPFRIRVINPSQAEQLPRGQKPAVVNVNLQRQGWRSHAGTYSSRVDCDTITHELLHLFRLCDEYQEGSLDYGGCRVVVRQPSIMSQSQETFQQTVPQDLTCSCNEGCRRVMNGTNEDAKRLYTEEDFIETSNYDFYKTCTESTPTFITDLAGKRKVSAQTAPDGTIAVTELGFFNDGRAFQKVFQCPGCNGNPSCEEGRRRLLNAIATPAVSTRSCPWYAGPEVRRRYVNTPPATGIVDGNLRIGTRPRFTNLLHPNHFNKILAGGCTDRQDADERSMYDQCASLSTMAASNPQCMSEETQRLKNRCLQPGVFTGAVQPQ